MGAGARSADPIQEYYAMVAGSYNRVSTHQDEFEADSALARCTAAAEDSVNEYPLTWTLGAFAVGIGLGAAIGASLSRPLGLQRQVEAENLARRVLDSIYDVLPDAVQRHVR
jgi:hypothetical protein